MYIYIYIYIYICVCLCINIKEDWWTQAMILTLVVGVEVEYFGGNINVTPKCGGRILIQTYSSSSLWKYASNVMNYQLYTKCQWEIFTSKGNGLVRMLRRKVKLKSKRVAKLNEMGRNENNGGGYSRRSRSSFYENN